MTLLSIFLSLLFAHSCLIFSTPISFAKLHSSVDKGDGSTKYTLKGEGAGSVFVIDGRTGNIHVTKPLDREEKDQYRLIATATDRQTGRALEPSSQFIIRVQDINDNPPLFLDGPYSATVPEMANIGMPAHHRARAASNGYFHSQLSCNFLDYLMSCLV